MIPFYLEERIHGGKYFEQIKCHYDNDQIIIDSFDLSPIQDALLKGDLDKIIESSESFWWAFCKAFDQIQEKKSEIFKTSLQENVLTITGKRKIHVISSLQNFLEEIRKIFEKKQKEKKKFSVILFKNGYDYYIFGKEDSINLRSFNNGLFYQFFNDIIRPAMPAFCESMGFKCSETAVPQIFVREYGFLENKTVEAFEIERLKDGCFVHPIEQKVIPSREDSQEIMYSMYKKQLFCDLSLIASDGSMKVHSLPLFMYGGEVIKTMLTDSMKESSEKTIYLNEFSLNSLKAFIDFVYLGERGLEPELVLDRDVDLSELFQLANVYQLQPLIDCCTNLFSLLSSPKDMKKIKDLAERYDNEHLKEMYEFFLLRVIPENSSLTRV